MLPSPLHATCSADLAGQAGGGLIRGEERQIGAKNRRRARTCPLFRVLFLSSKWGPPPSPLAPLLGVRIHLCPPPPSRRPPAVLSPTAGASAEHPAALLRRRSAVNKPSVLRIASDKPLNEALDGASSDGKDEHARRHCGGEENHAVEAAPGRKAA